MFWWALFRAGRLGDRSFAVVALGSSMKIGSHRSGRCWAHDARCSAQSSAWWAAACKATCLVCLGARHARPGAPWVAVAAMAPRAVRRVVWVPSFYMDNSVAKGATVQWRTSEKSFERMKD
eukprot:scaffold16163_cov49-Phaeocystis_antarctica.AAC.1